MKPPTRIVLRSAIRQQSQCTRAIPTTCTARPLINHPRQIHTTPAAPATVSPIHGTGPPPEPPTPTPDSASARLERRKKQAELLEKAKDIRQAELVSKFTASSKKAKDTALRKRFWKDVNVREVEGAWEVHLDSRPLRRPNTREVVRVPLSKPLLAAALAVEWDMLVSVQQATKQHLIPLTGLVCRALDIADDDAATAKNGGEDGKSLRAGLAGALLRYLDTDSLLCWAPPPSEFDAPPKGTETLRDLQKRKAEEVLGFLKSRVWPGVEIGPVLDGEAIMPKSHPEVTRQIVQGWIMGLNHWELAALERSVLACKGVLGAVRLLVEWSEGFVGTGIGSGPSSEQTKFGIEEAANLASIEVDWQTRRWGEVEDTHDVEKEDLRRQLGSAVLLVSGTGSK